MTSALWIAKTGLDAQQTRMSVISNNLANVNTTGFKRGRAQFEDLLYQKRSTSSRRPRNVGSTTYIRETAPVSLAANFQARVLCPVVSPSWRSSKEGVPERAVNWLGKRVWIPTMLWISRRCAAV